MCSCSAISRANRLPAPLPCGRIPEMEGHTCTGIFNQVVKLCASFCAKSEDFVDMTAMLEFLRSS